MIDEDKIIRLIADPITCYEGFKLLVESYQESVYWHIRRLVVIHEDAEDIMQDSFIKIYRHIHSFKGESSLKTWIYRVVTNEVIRWYSKKKLTTESYDQSDHLIGMFNADTHVDFTQAEVLLHTAILSLPEKQRVIFNMHYFDAMSYGQISEITGSNILAVRTNYHYANEKVKKYLLKNAR